MEELQTRHRREQRDLQNRITQKKKQANKKTRKGVNDECDRLEAELKERQQAEIAAANGEAVDVEPPGKELEDLTLKVDGEDDARATDTPAANGTNHAETNGASNTVDNTDSERAQTKKPNRQKARLARRAAEQEELARKAAEDAKNMPDLKQQERQRMLDAMKEHGLQEKDIRADGHCLYSAVGDQLEQLNIPIGAAPSEIPYKFIRGVAADYIEKHQDDFVPFMDEPPETYLQKLRYTGEWGGQLELMALAKSYGTDINVLQDFGRVEKVESGAGKADRIMWLSYYRHGFGLGEHYNSLRKAP